MFGRDGADEPVEIFFQAFQAGFAGVYVSADGLHQSADAVLCAQLRERYLLQIGFDRFEAFVGGHGVRCLRPALILSVVPEK